MSDAVYELYEELQRRKHHRICLDCWRRLAGLPGEYIEPPSDTIEKCCLCGEPARHRLRIVGRIEGVKCGGVHEDEGA